MKTPNFFIVGAPKCGTTALYIYIKQHPEIFMPRNKEPHFFGKDHTFTHRPRHSEEWYLSHFIDAGIEKMVGEASTSYLYSKLAAREIKEFSPLAKIIIMLRNPVDVMYAQHNEHLLSGFEYIEDFEMALNVEEKRKHGHYYPDRNGILENLFYRDLVKFTKQIKRYLDVFGRENVHIIIFDDLKINVAGVYRDTLSFLGVRPDFQPEFPVVNPNKSIRSTKLHNFLLHPPKIARSVVSFITPLSLRSMLVERVKRMNLAYSPRPPMDPELRRRLQREFSEEVAGLSELLQRDLTYWCRNEISVSNVE